jgi:F-type H+-transporting ATPase subunit b
LPSLLAQLVNFGILLGILYLVAYKPIMRMLDERANRIKDSIEQTEVIKNKAEKAEEEIARQLEEAGRQSQAVIDRGVLTGEELQQKAREEAKKESKALLARARNEIRRERDEVIDDLRREFADLTILAAGKVIDRTLDRGAHRQLIDKVLEEGTELKKGG